MPDKVKSKAISDAELTAEDRESFFRELFACLLTGDRKAKKMSKADYGKMLGESCTAYYVGKLEKAEGDIRASDEELTSIIINALKCFGMTDDVLSAENISAAKVKPEIKNILPFMMNVFRTAKKMTKREFSKLATISDKVVSAVENGKGLPSEKQCAKILRAVELSDKMVSYYCEEKGLDAESILEARINSVKDRYLEISNKKDDLEMKFDENAPVDTVLSEQDEKTRYMLNRIFSGEKPEVSAPAEPVSEAPEIPTVEKPVAEEPVAEEESEITQAVQPVPVSEIAEAPAPKEEEIADNEAEAYSEKCFEEAICEDTPRLEEELDFQDIEDVDKKLDLIGSKISLPDVELVAPMDMPEEKAPAQAPVAMLSVPTAIVPNNYKPYAKASDKAPKLFKLNVICAPGTEQEKIHSTAFYVAKDAYKANKCFGYNVLTNRNYPKIEINDQLMIMNMADGFKLEPDCFYLIQNIATGLSDIWKLNVKADQDCGLVMTSVNNDYAPEIFSADKYRVLGKVLKLLGRNL